MWGPPMPRRGGFHPYGGPPPSRGSFGGPYGDRGNPYGERSQNQWGAEESGFDGPPARAIPPWQKPPGRGGFGRGRGFGSRGRGRGLGRGGEVSFGRGGGPGFYQNY